MMTMKTIIILSLLAFNWWRKNMIMMLITLELLMISAFTLLATKNNLSSPTMMFIMLTLMVSASALGLSLLVMMSRSHNMMNITPAWTLM